LIEEASVFQGGFILSILDIVLVTLYFLLVHQVEVVGVAAFPPNAKPKLTDPSARSETWIILVVFAFYAAWDALSLYFNEKEYGPWPSAVSGALCALGLIPTYAVVPSQPAAVLCIDIHLFGLVFLFRAFKRLQKWNFENRRGETTFQFRAAPTDVKAWIIVCGAVSFIALVSAIAPLARKYICG
jgi:hypothetical protein